MKSPRIKPLHLILALAIAVLAGVFSWVGGRKILVFLNPDKETVGQVLRRIEQPVTQRLGRDFRQQGLAWPFDGEVALLAFKDQRRLEVYAKPERSGGWRFVKAYPVLAASGFLGPKLREGDRQVPEGLYTVEYLNPNSSFYLSFKINYPNEWDLARAREEGRDQPGSNIFIHGRAQSIGCLAMGDPAAEDLFYLVATVGKENVQVIIAPTDFRVEPDLPGRPNPRNARRDQPAWVPELYEQIRTALQPFPQPEHPAEV
jgi:hypothetical protein